VLPAFLGELFVQQAFRECITVFADEGALAAGPGRHVVGCFGTALAGFRFFLWSLCIGWGWWLPRPLECGLALFGPLHGTVRDRCQSQLKVQGNLARRWVCNSLSGIQANLEGGVARVIVER
jgi:hypothetical protein